MSKIYFISGHLDLTEEEFSKYYIALIHNGLDEDASFVIGDAKGTDLLAQNYLKGKSLKVTVYHMFAYPRNNVGFNTKGGFASDEARDKQMTNDSTHDIAWVRPGREKSGTSKNLKRRKQLSSI